MQRISVPSGSWKEIADQLFAGGHQIEARGALLSGTGTVGGLAVAVIGITGGAVIDVQLAFDISRAVLATIREAPGRPIVLLIDTDGQSLRRRDELLGISSYMAHLAKCLELARRSGHRVVCLVYARATSGAFLVSGMMADDCFALPQAEIRVMHRDAMTQVSRIPVEKLDLLSRCSPLFAPRAESYFAMGALDDLWSGDLGARLTAVLARAGGDDARASRGLQRGGRRFAAPVAQTVRWYDRKRPASTTCDGQTRRQEVEISPDEPPD